MNVNNINNFRNIQLVMALNPSIPIIINEPCRIYWNNQIYFQLGKKGYYKCIDCKVNVKLYNEIIYTQKEQNQSHQCCEKRSYKQDLVYLLMEKELAETIKAHRYNEGMTIRQHYNMLINKYQHKLPNLDLRNFRHFKYMSSNLRKIKGVTNPNKSTNLKHYFEKEFDKTLKNFVPSQIHRKRYQEELLYEIDHDSVLISNRQLMKILFRANTMGSDGTFNIRPKFKFVKENKTRYKSQHAQIYKIYGMYEYKDKNDKKVINSYHVAMGILKSKEEQIYVWTNNTIINWAKDMNLMDKSLLQSYICDFEQQQRTAADIIIQPLSMQQSGEEFHYTKAIHHHIQECGFQAIYQRGKNRPHHDPTFRTLISQFYALAHIECMHVKQYSVKSCTKLLQHISTMYEGDKQMYFNGLKFCIYFLKNWAEHTKPEIIMALCLTEQQQREFKYKLGSNKKQGWMIKDWNLHGKSIRTSNMIECFNKIHRINIGYFPSINKLIDWFLGDMENTIREYNNDQAIIKDKKFLPKKYQESHLKKKDQLLFNYKDKLINYEEFEVFSSELCETRRSNKYMQNITTNMQIAKNNRKRKKRGCTNNIGVMRDEGVSPYKIYNSSDSNGYIDDFAKIKKLKLTVN